MLQPQCPDRTSQTGMIDAACSSKAAVLCSRPGGCGEWLACLRARWSTAALQATAAAVGCRLGDAMAFSM